MTRRGARRGRKSIPPPPEVRRLPRLTDFNFAGDDVVRPLIEVGWNIDNAREEAASPFALAFNDPRQKLDRDVKAIVAHYVADVAKRRCRPAIAPSKFRARAAKLRNDVAKLLSKFPDQNASADDKTTADVLAVDSALAEAVNIELETQERANALNLARVRDVLSALLKAVDHVRPDEGIGPDPAAHVLLRNLADIYFRRTGSRPSAAPDGNFRQFVEAVNRQIPDQYQVAGLGDLIPGSIAAASLGPFRRESAG
jgi:hypothetical protein